MIVTVISLGLACLFGFIIYKQWAKRAAESESVLTTAVKEFGGRAATLEEKLLNVTKQLTDHREAMGFATTHLSEEIAKSKEVFYGFRRELMIEIEQVKSFTADVHRSMVLSSETTKIAMENLNEKIGRVITLEKNVAEMKESFGKVRVIVDQNNGDVAKHAVWFKQVTQILDSQKKALIKFRDDLAKK